LTNFAPSRNKPGHPLRDQTVTNRRFVGLSK
jgi:hypothetical protein